MTTGQTETIPRILLIEDEVKVARVIQKGLNEEGFDVAIAADGEAGLRLQSQQEYQLIIVDWMLPGADGLTVCRQIRRENLTVPILMLTARGTIEDRVRGLDCGADDYLTKPFAFAELVARVRALLRRSTVPGNLLVADNLQVDLVTRRVSRGGMPIYLSQKEFDLLVYLLQNKNRIVSREELASNVWDINFDTGTNYINVYINYLRGKLKMENSRQLIWTIRGKGYILKND